MFLSHLVQKIPNRLEPFTPDFETFITVPATPLDIAVRHAIVKTAIGVIALPPFPGLEGAVTCLPKELWESRVFQKSIDYGLATGSSLFLIARIVPRDSVLVGVHSGDDRGERRATERGGDVTSRKDERLRSQTIQVRSLSLGGAQEGVVRPAVIVGEEDDDIRPLVGERSRSRNSQKEDRQAPAKLEERDKSHGQ